MVFVLPQSFVYAKLPFLFLSLVLIFLGIVKGIYKIRSKAVPFYYVLFSIPVLLWGIIGTIRGNPEQAIMEAVRVYVVYMWIYAVLIVYISNTHYQQTLFPFFSLAALGVSFFCFYVLFVYLFGVDFLSDAVKEEMYLEIGIHDGYIQINNVNVGMFCFIIPFLFSSILLKADTVGKFKYIVLVIAVVSVMIASRRIVLVLFIITPALTFLLYRLSNGANKSIGKKTVAFYGLFSILASGVLFGLYEYNTVIFDGFTARVLDIFVVDKDSARQLQLAALMGGFYDYPLIGTGFGGITDVVRSNERPWTYELTYLRILFNSGLIGVCLLGVFFLAYFLIVLKKIRRTTAYKETYVAMMVGFLCVLIASASNPYLNSFDFIFVLSIIPLILNSMDTNIASPKEVKGSLRSTILRARIR